MYVQGMNVQSLMLVLHECMFMKYILILGTMLLSIVS
jgi:hypothetical protein